MCVLEEKSQLRAVCEVMFLLSCGCGRAQLKMRILSERDAARCVAVI